MGVMSAGRLGLSRRMIIRVEMRLQNLTDSGRAGGATWAGPRASEESDGWPDPGAGAGKCFRENGRQE
jgi:hypothetical protein